MEIFIFSFIILCTLQMLDLDDFKIQYHAVHYMDRKQEDQKLGGSKRKKPSESATSSHDSSAQLQLKPFWNQRTLEWSAKLWSGEEASLESNSEALFQAQHSWFSINHKKGDSSSQRDDILDPLWPKLSQVEEEKRLLIENKKKKKRKKIKIEEKKDNTKENEKKFKTRKVRIYPKPECSKLFIQWFGAGRFVYNKSIEAIKQGEFEGKKLTQKLLAQHCINKDSPLSRDNIWLGEIPYDIKENAVRDLIKARSTGFNNVKNGLITHFDLKFRSRKRSKIQSFTIRKEYWNKKTKKYRFFNNNDLNPSEDLPQEFDNSFQIVRNSCGNWYICYLMPVDVSLRNENQAPECKYWYDGIISIDPGVRKFAVGYDPSGNVLEWGKGDISRLYRLCKHLDQIISRYSQPGVKHSKRYKMKRAAKRMRIKIRNLVDDFHKKFVKFLLETYRVILLPYFETSQMTKKGGKRKIRKTTVRKMLTWSHYRFQQRLKWKSQEYPWTIVIPCSEAYTSKTCGKCGQLNNNLGGSETFNCPNCQYTVDRDVNGARNILLKFLTDNQISP